MWYFPVNKIYYIQTITYKRNILGFKKVDDHCKSTESEFYSRIVSEFFKYVKIKYMQIS